MGNLTIVKRRCILRKGIGYLLASCVLGMGIQSSKLCAEASPDTAVKAALLAKFPLFVRWPAGSGGTTVGILGDDAFASSLEGTVRLRRAKRAEDLKGCQVVFIAKSERGDVEAILATLAGKSVLTVGDFEGASKMGCVIGLFLEGGKVRFDINVGAARKAGLVIDSRLLQLAAQVVN